MDLQKELSSRFSQPLPDGYIRRIVFWYDPDGEFADETDSLCIDNLKIIKLTDSNIFTTKLLLSESDTQSDYLIYDPLTYDDEKDDWLIDIKLYSEEFRADLTSIRMQELNILPSASMIKAVKQYAKFFDNKSRIAKIKLYGTDYTSPEKLHRDIFAVLTCARDNTSAAIVRAVLSAGLNPDENDALINIKKFADEAVFWSFIEKYTGCSHKDGDSLIDFASYVFMTALSVTMDTAKLSKFDKYIEPAYGKTCYSIINEWQDSESNKLYDIAREVEYNLNLEELFDSIDISELLNSEIFPCINECIIKQYMTLIDDGVIRPDDITNTVERKKTQRWYAQVADYYDGLYYIAKMQDFYVKRINCMHTADYKELWNNYCCEYYLMDTYYRMFHTSFGRSLKASITKLDDLYKSTADYAEKLYKNGFLSIIGTAWSNLTSDEMTSGAELKAIPQQTDFYKNYVSPIASDGKRVYVIISDALRYEVGAELTDRIISETKCSAKISAVQSVFPSVTKFGMTALLPHTKIDLTDDMQVLCDGENCSTTGNREKILKKADASSVCLTYKSVIKMKQAQRREAVSNAKIVYIYHNAIDNTSENQVSEDYVFEACEQAITEIKNLVRILINDMSGNNIIITADHGFLYSYKPLGEFDKAQQNLISGDILELSQRYAITDNNSSSEYLIKIPLGKMNPNFSAFTVREYIRIKKPGGGINYVHGGISLQESAVPVIEVKSMRSDSKKFVSVKKAELQLISQSRVISNSIFSLDFYQKNPVGGKITPATYEMFISDESGAPVSDKRTVIADKTNSDRTKRVIKVRFTLKSMEFKKTDQYYLVTADKGTAEIVNKTKFTIDIAFVNDFDF